MDDNLKMDMQVVAVTLYERANVDLEVKMAVR